MIYNIAEFKILFLILYSIIQLNSQREDHVWVLGYDSKSSSLGYTTFEINFNNPVVDTLSINSPANFLSASSSICDENGNLLFYTNGCAVYSYKHELLKNGDGLNDSTKYFSFYCTPGAVNNPIKGYLLESSTLIVKKIGTKNQYFLLHVRANEFYNRLRCDRLYYTLIDMDADFGKGEVLEKNKALVSDTISGGVLDAVKHANGIDWWIINPKYNSSEIYTILLTKDGFQTPYLQKLGVSTTINDQGQSSHFTPDGKKWIRMDVWTGLHIYDFDRSNGEFSNYKHYPFWLSTDSIKYCGLEISANNRFLYVSTWSTLYQFDLESPSMYADRILIDNLDREKMYDIFLGTFFKMQLAPDGKIYMCCSNSSKNMHVINNPNEKGKNCYFQQGALRLPGRNAFSIPHFPNYRLGPLLSTESEIKQKLTFTPNPASHNFTFHNLDRPGVLRLYDQKGHQVLIQKLNPNYHIVYVNQLSIGMYFTSIEVDGKLYWDKLLKI